jgi:hypothetical protein
MAESVDAADLKSAGRKTVGVQVSLPPSLNWQTRAVVHRQQAPRPRCFAIYVSMVLLLLRPQPASCSETPVAVSPWLSVAVDPMPAIKFREIAHNSPDYGQAVALRSAILRQPLGFSFSSEQLQSEAGCHHLGASEAFACERGYQQLTLQPGKALLASLSVSATARLEPASLRLPCPIGPLTTCWRRPSPSAHALCRRPCGTGRWRLSASIAGWACSTT